MKLEIHRTIDTPTTLTEALSEHSSLSKSAIKKALNFGGGWIQKKGRGKKQRCRRATRALQAGDKISFYFDDTLYSLTPEAPAIIAEGSHWDVWYKPAGTLSQGSPFGDQGTMEAQVKQATGKQQIHLINRLDREVSGLILIAYNQKTAQQMQANWSNSSTQKGYRAIAKGKILSKEGTIDLPLDGKKATTHYQVIAHQDKATVLEIRLETGRFHQIRRHLNSIQHPLLGDPRYGKNNANAKGLQLFAHYLKFLCPATQKPIEITLPQQYWPF